MICSCNSIRNNQKYINTWKILQLNKEYSVLFDYLAEDSRRPRGSNKVPRVKSLVNATCHAKQWGFQTPLCQNSPRWCPRGTHPRSPGGGEWWDEEMRRIHPSIKPTVRAQGRRNAGATASAYKSASLQVPHSRLHSSEKSHSSLSLSPCVTTPAHVQSDVRSSLHACTAREEPLRGSSSRDGSIHGFTSHWIPLLSWFWVNHHMN
jgi:hypothetical protein